MQIGMIGLGRMGGNMVRRLMRIEHVSDSDKESVFPKGDFAIVINMQIAK